MVEDRAGQRTGRRRAERSLAGRAAHGPRRRGKAVVLAATAVLAALVVALGLPHAAASDPPSPARPSALVTGQVGAAVGASDQNPPASRAATEAPRSVTVPTPVPVASPPVSTPPVASLIATVEAAGIVPGPAWSWSLGATAAPCAVPSGGGAATGCTSWSSGAVHTVFAGSPSLALVAHEVANAETEQSALPALLGEVAAAEAGTSWSPTDAVASCLVVHFLGIDDAAAGSWRCPVPLAASVAAHIHDTVLTTQTTAVCGTASGTSSTLTFTASSGTLTVTSPSGGPAPQVASAGSPVTVSGVGTFTATVVGGTPTLAGHCAA